MPAQSKGDGNTTKKHLMSSSSRWLQLVPINVGQFDRTGHALYAILNIFLIRRKETELFSPKNSARSTKQTNKIIDDQNPVASSVGLEKKWFGGQAFIRSSHYHKATKSKKEVC